MAAPGLREISFALAAIVLGESATSCAKTSEEKRPVVSVPTQTAQQIVRIDDAQMGAGMYQLHYHGRWEHVHGYRDGRYLGTSSRTPYYGDGVSSTFEGRQLRVYGVTGPNGGHGVVEIDGMTHSATIDFYSPVKRTHVLVYQSPMLSPGIHVFALIASGSPRPHRAYVNIDDVEIVKN